jgi:hypothetical protein
MAEVNMKRQKQQSDAGAETDADADELSAAEASDGAAPDTNVEDADLEDEMDHEVVNEQGAPAGRDEATGQAATRERASESRRRSRGAAASAKRNEGTLARMFGWTSRPPADAAPPAGVAPLAATAAIGPTAPVVKRGRPVGTRSSGQGCDGSSAASHSGVKPGSLGANPAVSKRQRAEIRQAAAAAAAAAIIRGDELPDPSVEVEPRQRRSHAGIPNGLQLLAKGLEPDFVFRLKAVASRRCFQREDFVYGLAMSKVDWLQLEQDPWELRRAYAMAHFARLREDGRGLTDVLAEAARGVFYGEEGVFDHTINQTTLRGWLTNFIEQNGRLEPSQRGRHAKTESFLSDENIKEQAREWLSTHVAAARQKGEKTVEAVNGERFCTWCNEVLLADIIKAPKSKRERISLSKARAWMHTLGFSYRKHQETIYVFFGF